MTSRNQQTTVYAGLALIAVSALAIMSVVASPIQSAFAARPADVEQSANAIQRAGDNLVNAQVAVPANVNVQVTDVNACIIVEQCD